MDKELSMTSADSDCWPQKSASIARCELTVANGTLKTNLQSRWRCDGGHETDAHLDWISVGDRLTGGRAGRARQISPVPKWATANCVPGKCKISIDFWLWSTATWSGCRRQSPPGTASRKQMVKQMCLRWFFATFGSYELSSVICHNYW